MYLWFFMLRQTIALFFVIFYGGLCSAAPRPFVTWGSGGELVLVNRDGSAVSTDHSDIAAVTLSGEVVKDLMKGDASGKIKAFLAEHLPNLRSVDYSGRIFWKLSNGQNPLTGEDDIALNIISRLWRCCTNNIAMDPYDPKIFSAPDENFLSEGALSDEERERVSWGGFPACQKALQGIKYEGGIKISLMPMAKVTKKKEGECYTEGLGFCFHLSTNDEANASLGIYPLYTELAEALKDLDIEAFTVKSYIGLKYGFVDKKGIVVVPINLESDFARDCFRYELKNEFPYQRALSGPKYQSVLSGAIRFFQDSFGLKRVTIEDTSLNGVGITPPLAKVLARFDEVETSIPKVNDVWRQTRIFENPDRFARLLLQNTKESIDPDSKLMPQTKNNDMLQTFLFGSNYRNA